MRVLFVLTGLKEEGGGMFHSAVVIAEALANSGQYESVEILQLGLSRISVFSAAKVPVHYELMEAGDTWRSYLKRAVAAGVATRPTHVQAFDNRSYFFARLIAHAAKAKIFLVRPGGPNPTSYFPRYKDLIVFSGEGRDFFLKRFPKARVHLIPNRVSAVQTDVSRIAELQSELKVDAPILLRISRIGPYYEKSILQNLQLAKALRERGVRVSMVHIGFVEDEATLEKVRSAAGPEDRIVTDKKYTSHAARLATIAHAVVGTGRSLMEAAMAGRPVLTPLQGSPYPVLVTPENFEALANTNFSERNVLASVDPEAILGEISAIFSDDVAYDRARSFSEIKIAGEYDVAKGVDKLSSVYAVEQVHTPLGETFDLLLNAITVLRWYLPVLWRRRSA